MLLLDRVIRRARPSIPLADEKVCRSEEMPRIPMSRPTNLGDLTPEEWDRLEALLEGFEQAWHQALAHGTEGSTAANPGRKAPASHVDLRPFLPPPEDGLFSLALQELVKSELEIHWRRGYSPLLEDYVRRFPELGSAADLPASLIYEEYRVRQLYGDRPLLSSYQERFPLRYPEFANYLERESILGTAPTPPAPTPVNRERTRSFRRRIPHAATPISPAPGLVGPEGILPIGGGYQLIHRLGSGSFGEVWRAAAPGGVPVAVKIIFRSLEHEEAQRELESLELIKQLTHPFLLKVHGFWPLQDRLIIVMELAQGSLRDRLKECRQLERPGIPLDELMTYFRESAEALDYLHGKHVLHRDIKPDNLLLLERHAHVADFGLARLLKESLPSAPGSGSGTPSYMAPEVWRGRIHEHSDQYSLAATYAELRLDRRLYQGRDMISLMIDHLESTPNLAPLQAEEQQVLLRALAKDPEERFPSCQAFFQALELAVGAGRGTVFRSPPSTRDLHDREPNSRPGAPTVPDLTPSQRVAGTSDAETVSARTSPDSPHRSRRALVVFLSLLLLIAVAILCWYLGQWYFSRPAPTPVFLPPRCEKADGAVVRRVNGRDLHDRIDRLLEDGTRIRFLLIPGDGGAEPVSQPFYIMENKVSNGLFRKFVDANPDLVKSELWRQGALLDSGENTGSADDRLPVMRVSLEEAYAFARWLDGDLPTIKQWDLAAGRHARERGKGPFEGEPDTLQPGDVAIDRGARGPMPVGSAPRDRSIFGCRDMAGNGLEWTRDFLGEHLGTPIPVTRPTPDLRVHLRGRDFAMETPLSFDENDLNHFIENTSYLKPMPNIGFRVVIPVPSNP
jgi:serine/threonine protein kinase